MNDTDWQSYLRDISTNQSEIARATGVHSGTVSRWLAGASRPSATQVIAVARAYDRSPVLALVAADYLTRAEVEQQVQLTPGMSLAEFSELDIAQELVRRIEAGETTEASEAPLEVDHPAWDRDRPSDSKPETSLAYPDQDRPDVGALVSYWNGQNGELKLHIATDGADLRFFDPAGNEFSSWNELLELASAGVIERLPSAAKSAAHEVEEEDHTP